MKEYNTLDAAWQFFEAKISEGFKKKEIVDLLNEAGFTTLKGKPWTYQTILLEQRKRGGGRGAKKKASSRSVSLVSSVSAPDVETFFAGEAPLEVPLSQRLEQKLALDSFEGAMQYFLNESIQMSELTQALGQLGIVDGKGHAWNEVTLNYHLANALLRNSHDDKADPKGGLLDILEKSRPVHEEEPSEYDLKRDAMWALIDVELARGVKNKALVGILNMNGFMTRRGKMWTYQTLMHELKRRPKKIESKGDEGSDEFDSKSLDSVLDFAREKIEREILPLIKTSSNSRGNSWNYKRLAWELLKRDLDV